jgi:hypothetical protein
MIDMERFNLKEVNDVEVKEQYEVRISNLDDNVDINRAWEMLRDNIKTSYKSLGDYELKQDKSVASVV